jgi:diacylglycerol kinase
VKQSRRTWSGKFADAFRGLFLAVRTHSSYGPHLLAAALTVALAAALRLEPTAWCLVVLAIGGVLVAETFNTAIEELARAVGRYPDDGIRDALDVASGGVLAAVGTALVVGGIVFLPRLAALVW